MSGVVEPVPLQLDKLRHLKLSYPTLMLAEREVSRVWERKVNLLTLMSDGIGLNDLHVLLWAALLWEDPGLTLLKVQDLMEPADTGAIMDAVVQAWLRAWRIEPTPQEDAGAAAGPLVLETRGTASGVLPA